MKQSLFFIIVVLVLFFSIGALCSCGVTECEICLGTGEVVCPECDGDGQIESEDLCVYCGGTGTTSYGYYYDVCPFCNGDGYEEETEICMNCGGLGTVMCEVCDGQGEY